MSERVVWLVKMSSLERRVKRLGPDSLPGSVLSPQEQYVAKTGHNASWTPTKRELSTKSVETELVPAACGAEGFLVRRLLLISFARRGKGTAASAPAGGGDFEGIVRVVIGSF
jgi:hypothetical protein